MTPERLNQLVAEFNKKMFSVKRVKSDIPRQTETRIKVAAAEMQKQQASVFRRLKRFYETSVDTVPPVVYVSQNSLDETITFWMGE